MGATKLLQLKKPCNLTPPPPPMGFKFMLIHSQHAEVFSILLVLQVAAILLLIYIFSLSANTSEGANMG